MTEPEAACKTVRKWIGAGMERKFETREPARVIALGDIGPGAEEAVLVTAARMGHPTAFGYLVERHAGVSGGSPFGSLEIERTPRTQFRIASRVRSRI